MTAAEKSAFPQFVTRGLDKSQVGAVVPLELFKPEQEVVVRWDTYGDEGDVCRRWYTGSIVNVRKDKALVRFDDPSLCSSDREHEVPRSQISLRKTGRERGLPAARPVTARSAPRAAAAAAAAASARTARVPEALTEARA